MNYEKNSDFRNRATDCKQSATGTRNHILRNQIQLGNRPGTRREFSHDFRFVNTGDKPLTIKNIITGCGCTSSEWTEKAYQPGEEGIIRLATTRKAEQKTTSTS